MEAKSLDSPRKADAILGSQEERRKESIPFRYKAPRREQLWEDEGQQVQYPRSLLRRRLSILTTKGSAHLWPPTVGASMPEVRENQCPQGDIIHYDIMESSSLPSAESIGSIQRPVGGHSQGIGPQIDERMEACGSMETSVPCIPSTHVLTELLESCSQSADCSSTNHSTVKLSFPWTSRPVGELSRTSNSRLWSITSNLVIDVDSWLHLPERRDTGGPLDTLVPSTPDACGFTLVLSCSEPQHEHSTARERLHFTYVSAMTYSRG